jgi:MFS family permease
LLGTLLGSVAGITSAVGIYLHNFWLFTLASMLLGGYAGFTQYYRFAAADIASPEFRSRAISWVVAGGVVAAVAGPNLVRMTQHWGSQPFIATYVTLTVLSIAALAVISRLALPPLKAEPTAGIARPLWAVIRQPVFLTAVIGSTVGFAVMSTVMTATPIAMLMSSHTMNDSASVIQWHVLGMYLPSFFTGALIRRLGVLGVMGAGIVLLWGHVAIALSGIAYLHFLSGLILLGVGWNFLFVGGTTLLTEAYRPAERAKVQATHDFIMFGVVSMGSLSAGGALNHWGWASVNFIVMPFLLLAAIAVGGLALQRRTSRSG